METYFYVLIFLIGLSLGSFFNVLVFRFNTDQSAMRGRSKCPNCQSVIKWFDLIPVISYLFLGGKCRKCRVKISPIYLITELVTASALLLFFLNISEISYLTALSAFTILLLVLIIFIDIRYLIIPNRILVLLAIVIAGLKLLGDNVDFYNLLISALGLSSFFVILFLVSKGRWIGLGDVKLIFIIGFLLGYPMGYLAVISSVWLAAAFSIVLLVSGRATAKTEIPFGSFLSVITIIFIVFNYELQEISKYFY